MSNLKTQAWYRRGTANASLGNYKEAINDLNVAKTLESSSGGKSQIETELTRLLNRHSRIISPPLEHTAQELNNLGEMVFTISQLIFNLPVL